MVPGLPASAYGPTLAPRARPAALRHFSDRYLAFSYPSGWEAGTYTEVSNFTYALVFLSAQPMRAPCVTVRKPRQVTVACG